MVPGSDTGVTDAYALPAAKKVNKARMFFRMLGLLGSRNFGSFGYPEAKYGPKANSMNYRYFSDCPESICKTYRQYFMLCRNNNPPGGRQWAAALGREATGTRWFEKELPQNIEIKKVH